KSLVNDTFSYVAVKSSSINPLINNNYFLYLNIKQTNENIGSLNKHHTQLILLFQEECIFFIYSVFDVFPFYTICIFVTLFHLIEKSYFLYIMNITHHTKK